MPKVSLLTSPSPRALEDELVARVSELSSHATDSVARVAIIVPTSLLAERVQRALARAGGAEGLIAGVEILHHRRLAIRLLELAYLLGVRETPAPRLLGAMESDALARSALATLPDSASLRRLADERPRIVLSLARTLGEVREAMLPDGALSRVLGAGPHGDDNDGLAAVQAAHAAALAQVEVQLGATDAAGHALAAALAARGLGRIDKMPWTHVIHHGSYELVGCQAELLRAIAECVPTTVLAPSGDGPAHEASRRSLARWPGVTAQRLDAAPTLLDVEALFDESRSAHATGAPGETSRPVRLPAPAAFPRVEAVHCRGTRTEIETAARLAAEAHLERDVPLEDIAIVARSLEPFAGHLEAAFAAQGLPFMTGASVPLLREPWAQAATTLLQVLSEDLPRPALAEFLRQPWAELRHAVSSAEDIVPDLWDAWTLEARVVRGATAYAEDLSAWHRADIASRAGRDDESPEDIAALPFMVDRERRLVALAEVVAALASEAAAWSTCTTAAEHAAFLGRLFTRWLGDPAERKIRGMTAASALVGSTALRAAIDEMASLESLPGSRGQSLSMAAARALIASALAGCGLPIGRRDGSGVRVLSAMPARGIPFREIILVGLNQGAFPRRPRQDPFLRDGARLKLRAMAPALQVKAESRDEERQIFALLLAAASDRVVVTWQRANDDGKARAASLYLREIARLALGVPHLESLTGRSRAEAKTDALLPLLALPGHPSDAARRLRERAQRATFRDAALEASQRSRRRAAVEALSRGTNRLDDALADALATVGLLDDFTLDSDPVKRDAQLAHDGILGPELGAGLRPDALSATSLETLGSCSLRWLFERGLGVRALADEPEEGAVAAADLGTLVHGVLEDLGGETIRRGGAPGWMDSDEAVGQLRAAWNRRVDELAGTRKAHAPIAWEALSERWLTTLEEFIRADASRLSAMGAVIVAVEQDIDANVEFSSPFGPVSWRLRGRVDRILATPRGWRIEDYKTRADVSGLVTPAGVLKGERLQGSLYAKLGEHWATITEHPFDEFGDEVSVGFVPVHPEATSFEPKESEALNNYRESCHETFAVLDGVFNGGAFAFRAGAYCEWCAVRAACRKGHVPSQERLRAAGEVADYLDLSGKSSRALSLEAVRARRMTGRDEDES